MNLDHQVLLASAFHSVGRGDVHLGVVISLAKKGERSALHRELALRLNQMDGTPSRKVMYQFWDTELTFETSYLARLNYVWRRAVLSVYDKTLLALYARSRFGP